ncbi:MAG TPA: MFS transporter [Caulobacteraceae bacterium]
MAADRNGAKRRLGAGTLTLYGSGALVETVVNFALGQFLLFYLTLVCGLSGSMAGLVGLLSLTLDAFVDPLVGSWSDGIRSRWGRRHPFVILAGLPTGVSLTILFTAPAAMHGTGLFVAAVVLSLLVRIALSCFQVPYFALGAELSQDYVERSTIVSARVAFGVVGTLAATALSYGYFLAGDHGTMRKAAYVPLMASFGAIALIGSLASGLGTLSSRHRLHAPPPPVAGRLKALVAEIKEIFANRSFRVLFSAILLFFVAQGVAGPLTLYANTYFWKISTLQIRDLTFVFTGGLFVGVIVTAIASRWLEKRTVALTGLFMFITAQLVPAPLRAAGLIRTPAEVMAILAAAVILLGLGTSAALIGYQSMMADAADEHEHLFQARREGLYFAGINFSAKASSGLGVLIAGLVLDLIGFPHGTAATLDHLTVPAQTVLDLGLIYGPGAAVLSAISVTILFAYRLDRARHGAILEALGRRSEPM